MATNFLGRDYLLYLGTTAPTNGWDHGDANYTACGDLTSVSVSYSRAALDKSSKDDGADSSFVAGRRNITLSLDTRFDHTMDAGQEELFAAIEAANGTVYFLVTTTTSGDEEWYGSGIVTSISPTWGDDAVSGLSAQIQVSGAITRANGT